MYVGLSTHRTASPKGSRPGLPTVHSPKVKWCSGRGVYESFVVRGIYQTRGECSDDSGHHVTARLVAIGGTPDLLVVLEVVCGLRVWSGNGEARKRLEVRQRRIAPPAGLSLLDGEE